MIEEQHVNPLRLWRAKRGMSTRRLSEITGISAQALGRYERGAMPPKSALVMLSDIGVDVGALVVWEPNAQDCALDKMGE